MDKVLKLVNQARVAQGLRPIRKLLKGIQSNGFHCPLTRSLQAAYVGSYVRFNVNIAPKIYEVWHNNGPINNGMITTPKPLKRFIEDFDDGYYPELVLKGNRVR